MQTNIIIQIIDTLTKRYGIPKSYVEWGDDKFRLLIGTILAAQERDDKVNRVLDSCWEKYNTAQKIVDCSLDELKQDLSEIGMGDMKAERIKVVAQMLLQDYRGRVPDNFNYLVSLPGVGRKTAGIVMLYGYGLVIEVPVDTHVRRLCNRIGICNKKTPTAISNDLRSLPDGIKRNINFALVSHGKNICRAINPRCESCTISDLCEKNNV